MSSRVIFINSDVSNYQTLITQLPTDSEVVLLDTERDGVMQIAAALQGKTNLDAIDIISHGVPGSLKLGSGILNSNNLADYAVQLSEIGKHLSDDGDILLYGCDVAQGKTGRSFVDQLARLTGADVAASDDMTGNPTLGGDWVLEQSTGAIEALPIQSQTYNSTLAGASIASIFAKNGYYTTLADLSKAVYHLAPEEQKQINQKDQLGNTIPPNPNAHGTGANYIKPYADVAFNRIQADWSILKAADLGQSNEGTIAGTNKNWFLENEGIYHCENAAAIVVRCGDAVVLSFRGTNDNDNGGLSTGDVSDWTNMADHYAELIPFIDSVDSYIRNNDVTNVYVTGHSLGGAMVLSYMSQHILGNTVSGLPIKYEAVTFGAPGYNFSGQLDQRVVCLENDGDPVADIPYKQGYIVSTNLPLTHTTGSKNGEEYGLPADYHSMDIYLQVAKALDSELSNTSYKDIATIHGFRSNMFSSIDYGLEVSLHGKEELTGTEKYSFGINETAPRFSLMSDDDDLPDTGNVGETDYFLGGAGKDTLGGANFLLTNAGIGVLIGGADDDTYIVDDVADSIIEKVDAGNDTVESEVSYTLPENVENLKLALDSGWFWFDANIDATGNTLNNNLLGNAAKNTLIGLGGTDTLEGYSGNDTLDGRDNAGGDTLRGGADHDTYYADGGDTVIDSDGHGRISVGNILLTGGAFVEGANVYRSNDGRAFYQPSANGITAYVNIPKADNTQGFQQINIQAPLSPPSTDSSGTTTSGISGMGVGLTKNNNDQQDSELPERVREAQQTVQRRDPLTFDLDNDGLETTGISITNPILFDHDGDGIRTATGWVKADDAFLVQDRNGNGSIDNGAELFGDNTPLAAGGKAADGFAALADLDSNQDGKISSADTQFANLRLWRDLNQNGVSDTGELFTLNTLGIASINIIKQINSQVLPDGNRIADLGTYTRTNGNLGGLGETSQLGDIDLIENTFFRTFANPLDTTAVAHLPDMRGSGQIRDLREAATLSPALVQLLSSFVADTAYSGQKAKLGEIIKAWSDTSTMKTTFTGAFDGHPLSVSFAGIATGSAEYQAWVAKLTIIERFNGQTFRPVPVGTEPININIITEQLTLLQQGYDLIHEAIFGSLVKQTRLKPFLDLIQFKTDNTGAFIDFTATKNALQAGINANTAAGMANLLDFEKYAGSQLRDSGWDGTDIILSNLLSLPITPALQAVYDDYGARTAGSSGTDQNDFLLGNNLDNALDGKNGDDFLFGSGGNDTLSGGAGNDMLVGGAGNDVLNGGIAGGYGVGDDTYQFGIGSGQDTINDYDSTLSNSDKIQLGAGILPGDVSVSRNGNDLILRFATNTTDQITVPNWYSNPDYRIEQLTFANGTVWDQADLYNKGNLSFAPKVDYSIINFAYSVSADDFNGDGQVDLAITNANGASPLSILLRNATNTDFEPGVDYPLSGNPSYAVHSGDFNSDGKTDLAIANFGSNTVSVMLRNNINSGFEPIVNYATGSFPNSVNVADFNNDGKLDLVTANSGNSVSILLRNATNTDFDTKVDYVTGTYPMSVSVGDFNNDGRPDVAVANYLNDTVSVLLRNAANTGFDPKIDYTTGLNPQSICVGDFNNDGKLDLAVAHAASNTVSVLLRNATNTGFDPKTDYAVPGVSHPTISAADFNTDGKTDLAITYNGNNTVSVLLRNTANTGFDPQVDYAIGDGNASIGVADFNSDGKLDLAISHNSFSNNVSFLLNNTNTTPTLIADTTTTFTAQVPTAVANTIAINDIDGDADWNGGSLRVQITGNASTNDSLLLPATNNGGIWLNTTGNILMANTMAIGSADAAFVTGGAAWTLTFNSAATNALVQSTAQAIQFNNTSGSPSTADRTVTFTTLDKNTGYDTAVQTIKVTVTNHSPTLMAPLLHQAVKIDTVGWSYNVSASFSDEDASDVLSYSATLANGNPLPAWIQMNAASGLLTGTPGFNDHGTYSLTVKATDTHGSSITAPVTVAVTSFDAGKLLVSTAGNDILAGTASNDTVTYAFATAPVTVSLATTTQQNTLGAGLDTLTAINNLIGSDFNDNLTGSGQNNALEGGAGNDTLNGAGGADTMIGGLGNDTFVVNNVGDVSTEFLNEGTDKVNSNITYTLPLNIENLTLTGTIAINGTGNDLDNVITGNGAANQLHGQAGNDTLNGGSGDDTLTGWSGADTMIGGLGNDTYFVENTGDIVTENLNAGTDTASTRLTYTLPNNVENLILTGTTAVNGTGNALANVITGNNAVNQLNGQAGNDTLNGGAGNDILDGGTGINTLTGGTGNDVFKLTTAGHIDTIADYNVANDTLQLENAVFTALTITGVVAADQFRVGTQALDNNDFVIYNNVTGALLYDANGNGAGAAVQIATLSAGLAMTNLDLVVI